MDRNRLTARRAAVALTLVLGFGNGVACSTATGERATQVEDQTSGQVRLALTTSADTTFRLRHARFAITDSAGNEVLTLDSEQDPSAAALSADLPQASYSLELRPGWTLERQAEDGSFSELQAALVSANPRTFEVRHQRVTELVYSFTTEAGVITLGSGSLALGIDVVSPASATPCRVLDPSSCPNGFTCLLAGEDGQAFCAQPGTLAVGAECQSEQCVAGAQCLRATGETTGVCKRFCDPAATTFCSCRSLSFDAGLGVCEQPPSCEPSCNVSTFAFTESTADDVSANALYDFFSGLTARDSDYILFQIDASAGSGAWCASNASFYVNSYLAAAPGANTVISGAWDKYVRGNDGVWSGPDYAQYTNYFGQNCQSSPFDWCSEWGLGGRYLAVMPAQGVWESLLDGTFRNGGSIKISVGPSRAATCGF